VNVQFTKRALFIGWVHLSCIFWNKFLSFTDDTRLEVQQDMRLTWQRNVCKYCHLDCEVFKTTSCAYKDGKGGSRCNTSFHIRCALRRGLVVDYETMF
jgi:hypothetical protein